MTEKYHIKLFIKEKTAKKKITSHLLVLQMTAKGNTTNTKNHEEKQ
jgi:hypothetical protein